MELTTSELVALRAGIRQTADMDLPAVHSVSKRVNVDRIQPLIGAAGKEESQKREEYANETDDQGNILDIDEEAGQALSQELNDLMQDTWEVDLRTIPWTVIREKEISDRNLARLRFMISGLPDEYEQIFDEIDTKPGGDEE